MRVAYNKLVRDQIPDIIAAAGSRPSTRVLDHASYQGALRSKLVEEAQEAELAPDEQLASELADVLEVLRALAMAHGMTWERHRTPGQTQAGRTRRLRSPDLSRARRPGLEADAGVAAFLVPGGCG
jgi:predicted house-cleaning noncanonical NTP pyrophosphatase (MazG superfamily)